MKKYLSFMLFTAIALNLFAQDDLALKSDYNYIDRSDFYILKTGSDIKGANKLAISELTGVKGVEQLFGSDHKMNKYPAALSAAGFTRIVYPDGLSVNLPENGRNGLEFEITSDKYTMVLANGQTIKVGMKGDEIKEIFPKSYSKRIVIDYPSPDEGKTYVRVYFSRLHNNKVAIEGNSIVFVLSKEDNILEQICTSYPY